MSLLFVLYGGRYAPVLNLLIPEYKPRKKTWMTLLVHCWKIKKLKLSMKNKNFLVWYEFISSVKYVIISVQNNIGMVNPISVFISSFPFTTVPGPPYMYIQPLYNITTISNTFTLYFQIINKPFSVIHHIIL